MFEHRLPAIDLGKPIDNHQQGCWTQLFPCLYVGYRKNQFYAAAYVDFFDIPRTGMGRAESSIPADDCRWAYQDLLQAGDARISGFTVCQAKVLGHVEHI